MNQKEKSWNGRDLDWRTKSTDRFVLRWIKLYLSAPLTLILRHLPGLRPWMVTCSSAFLGTGAGALLALGYGWQAGLTAAVAQVLDGTDGQLARLTGRQSRAGAMFDSVLDRYMDNALILGCLVYLLRLSLPFPFALPTLLIIGFLALVGSNLVSFSSARAGELDIDLGRPSLVSKGTRTTVVVLTALLTVLMPTAPFIALVYIALHTNAVIVYRLVRTYRQN